MDALLKNAGQIYAYVGPVGIVLLALSVLSLALIFAKIIVFAAARLGNQRAYEAALAALEAKGPKAALEALGRDRHPISEMLRAGATLADAKATREMIEAAVAAAGSVGFERLGRYNRLLELIGLIAPLLGLLGTILGMISAFRALETSGAQADPVLLAGGIWEALLTTALGLAVAIPAIVAFHLAENRLDRLRRETAAALARFYAHLGR